MHLGEELRTVDSTHVDSTSSQQHLSSYQRQRLSVVHDRQRYNAVEHHFNSSRCLLTIIAVCTVHIEPRALF